MKVAIVHDWLNTKDGGAELVLRNILELYPEADVFTLVYNRRKFARVVGDRRVITSPLQIFPRAIKRRPQFLLPFIHRAVKRLNLTGYDLVISSSGAWCKNVTVPASARHICYCHSPARMLWVNWPSYVDSFHFSGFRFVPFSRLYVTRLCSKLRLWDYYGAQDVDQFVANSHYVAERIHKFYGRDAQVIYPGADIDSLRPSQPVQKADYYLVVSTLARYKNLDVVVEAFAQTGRRLLIAGDGPDRGRLEKLARHHSNIEFLGFVSQTKKVDLLQHARALIFANVEDFGLTPIEALAAGTPVVALRGGGASETLVAGQTGWFFDQPTAAELNQTVQEFEKHHPKPEQLTHAAERFAKAHFKASFQKAVDAL